MSDIEEPDEADDIDAPDLRRPLVEQDDPPAADRQPVSPESRPGAGTYDTTLDPMEYARSLGDDALADYVDGQPDDIKASLLADADIGAVYRRTRRQGSPG